ncbi:hypothetical protein PtrSN002B_010947 [Pyrenophora tritici-repentis]|uniref:Uncharacterized protein n=2 Tax=Pyrenophora tritici-repentis TaxID=45151 RepID=A0A2W1FEF6_9PLEO|nr:hypothetical protein PtrV1_13515 [Pyrenophora tritici-repentis]KAG9382446.1 hypothetical protein A1F94_006367 [Pyrenophora tritici-repentis]KAI0569816.1 hypothetical protein Alg215_11420 [Pyrenophora tritici-repentis]KAI1509282.1 hypothetical protein Ptr86124_011822 [Pyrenophora tritici-repentis]KAI1524380.1 hypothetical protein PtrSN001C_011064 [Pyrenophora tritici-repentis]
MEGINFNESNTDINPNSNQQIPTFFGMEGSHGKSYYSVTAWLQSLEPQGTGGIEHGDTLSNTIVTNAEIDGSRDRELDLVKAMKHEVSEFTEVMEQLFHDMHARMKKAEYERDVALGKIRPSENMNGVASQSAPQFGRFRFHDAEGAPMTSSPLAASDDVEDEEEYVQEANSPFIDFKFEASKKNAGRRKAPNSLSSLLVPKATSSTSQSFSPTKITKRPSSKARMHYAKHVTSDMVSSKALIPNVPLTDTEVIVFFYQTTARPVVALRLYARGWGPAKIADVLTVHRGGEYLRNSCSVKCTASIKKGKKNCGEDWLNLIKEAFEVADDAKATELIRYGDREMKLLKIVDAKIKSLAKGVINMPKVGKGAGLFTKYVEYCAENELDFRLSQTEELSEFMKEGQKDAEKLIEEIKMGYTDMEF